MGRLVLTALAAAVAAAAVAGHAAESGNPPRCIHDQVQREVKVITELDHPHSMGRRRMQAAAWAGIRITPLFQSIGSDPQMNETLTNFLIQTLVPTAIGRWSELLQVQPVQGPLYANRVCASYYTNVQPWLCASYAASPVTCNSGDGVSVNINDTLLGADSYYNSNPAASPRPTPVVILAGAGLPNADFGLYVTAVSTSSCGSAGSGTLAYAYTCQRDSMDRPTWGRINFCPSALNADPTAFPKQLGVALHEMAHALGFSASSWPLFRDSAGTPRTARDPNRPDRPSSTNQLTYNCQSQTYSPYFPAATTVNYFQERGATCTYNGTMLPTTNCVHKMVTPAALAAARFFFNCSTLNGAELENQMTTPCDLQGSHWEQRIFSTELMSSYAQHNMLVTPMTLAAFEDSGWYRPVYTAADWLRPASDWGFSQGCTFATSKCLTASTSIGTPAHFGASSAATGTYNAVCTTDRRALAFVSVVDYTGSLPAQYQYFSGFPQRGGSLDVLDYCPAVTAYSNALCGIAANSNSNSRFFGETYGSSSACFTSTLRWTTISPNQPQGAGCFAVTCANGTASITITAGAGQSASTVVTCGPADEGATRTAAGYNGALTCPPSATLCGNVLRYNGTSGQPVATAGPWPFPQATPTPSASSTRSPVSATSTPVLSPSPGGPQSSRSAGAGAVTTSVTVTLLALAMTAVAVRRRADE